VTSEHQQCIFKKGENPVETRKVKKRMSKKGQRVEKRGTAKKNDSRKL